MKSVRFFSVSFMIVCMCLNFTQVYALSISLDMANKASLLNKKNVQASELKVTGALNQNTLNSLLNLYPNIESIDLLNSNIVAFTDKNKVLHRANEIPTGAFNKKVKLKTVILPRAVTKIGKGAFWGCSELTNVVLPSSIKVIDRFAFQLCVKLKTITFPEGLESIGGATFASCQSLATVKCMSKKPPEMPEWNPFTDLKLTDLVMYVPAESVEIYQKLQFLKCFQIKALIVKN